MQQTVAVDQIEARAKALNLSLGDIAEAAGLHKSTAYRFAEGKRDCRRSTEIKLSKALIALELQTLQHLLGLHGTADNAADAA